jgi:sulfur carrier protein ThiS adenylyltransferase
MIITLNGKKKDIKFRTAFEVRREFGKETDIVILNGFQIDKDCELSENDTLSVIPRAVCLKKMSWKA